MSSPSLIADLNTHASEWEMMQNIWHLPSPLLLVTSWCLHLLFCSHLWLFLPSWRPFHNFFDSTNLKQFLSMSMLRSSQQPLNNTFYYLSQCAVNNTRVINVWYYATLTVKWIFTYNYWNRSFTSKIIFYKIRILLI